MSTINVRAVTGDDIASLLLLCAPANILTDHNLVPNKYRNAFVKDINEFIKGRNELVKYRNEFIKYFNELDSYWQVEIFAEALYYANRSTTMPRRESDEIIQSIYIPPIVIRSLVQYTRNEEFLECDGMYTSIADDKQLKPSSTSKSNNQKLWAPYISKFNNLIDSGMKPSKARREIANMMENDGVWKTKSNPKEGKIIILKRPDRGTLIRNLVVDSKKE